MKVSKIMILNFKKNRLARFLHHSYLSFSLEQRSSPNTASTGLKNHLKLYFCIKHLAHPDLMITTMASHNSEDSDPADTGYLPTTEQEEDDLEELADPWHKYDKSANSWVFYPIRIGEVLDQRYRIDHKISHGGVSTVWMAHDIRDKRDVALKIMASSGEFGEHELYMLNEICRDVKNASNLIVYLRTFLIHGDECEHRVLVFPLRGECLVSLNVEKKSMHTRMSAAKQLLEALKSLHGAGFVHRGEYSL